MWVQVVQLRERGVRIERWRLQSAPGVVGVLSLGPQTVIAKFWEADGNRQSVAARIRPAQPGERDLLPQLADARVSRIRDGALVIVGAESIGVGGSAMTYPQAWWCRLVPPAHQGVTPLREAGAAVPA